MKLISNDDPLGFTIPNFKYTTTLEANHVKAKNAYLL